MLLKCVIKSKKIGFSYFDAPKQNYDMMSFFDRAQTSPNGDCKIRSIKIASPV